MFRFPNGRKNVLLDSLKAKQEEKLKKIPQILVLDKVPGWTEARHPFMSEMVHVVFVPPEHLYDAYIARTIGDTPTVLIGRLDHLYDLVDKLPKVLNDDVPLAVLGLFSSGDRIVDSTKFSKILYSKIEEIAVRSVYHNAIHMNSPVVIEDIRALVHEVMNPGGISLPVS
ncbi:MAG TPA: hypothetical protein PLF31_01640 [Candidatus Paceibacterota bacterium]|nr:hypothetical protein [Candidatus Paceibacterota bacterium]